ncbi:MAG: pentapeptide repeat-containing protein [Bacteroidetes bacterium]|nr:pentapeptide repeat-containing protein [Bacteroidota bacterium]
METTISCGPQFAENVNISGSKFHNVNLSGSDFDNVNLSNTRFHDISMSNIKVSAVNLGGATFQHLGPPPDKDGNWPRQRPVLFEEAMLCDSVFRW